MPHGKFFSECYWLQTAPLTTVSLTILYVKGLDIRLLDKTELIWSVKCNAFG
jgi:hypothetical protein